VLSVRVCASGGEVGPGHPFHFSEAGAKHEAQATNCSPPMAPPPTMSAEVSRPEKKRQQKEYQKTLGAAKKGDPQAGHNRLLGSRCFSLLTFIEPQRKQGTQMV